MKFRCERDVLVEALGTAARATASRGGTGIGLAATRKIIQDHGGTIEFESEVGAGTTFRIYLPVCAG